MIPPGLLLRMAGAVGALLVLFGVYWVIDHNGYTRGKSAVESEYHKRSLEAAAEYADKLKTAEEQHGKDQAVIARLSADARRVRVHIPTCPAVEAGANPDGRAGAFQQGVDEAFARLQAGVGSLVERCDQLNIDARRANAQ